MPTTATGYQPVIKRFTAACEADERVVAAFLAGSVARGAADAYSDLDLCLVTRDADRERFWADREAFLNALGDPLLAETFDSEVTVHFVLADGTEGELSVGPESRFVEIHGGPFVALVDKTGILHEATFPSYVAESVEQREVLRRELMWFWHDLSHAIAAIGREHLWWALASSRSSAACA
jgi:predicted nucleotidyltransferase